MKLLKEDELLPIIKQWIKHNQQQNNGVSGDPLENTDLIGSGVLDSLGFIELLVYLETVTEEKIDLNDVDPREFTTMQGLCKSVMATQNNVRAGG